MELGRKDLEDTCMSGFERPLSFLLDIGVKEKKDPLGERKEKTFPLATYLR